MIRRDVGFFAITKKICVDENKSRQILLGPMIPIFSVTVVRQKDVLKVQQHVRRGLCEWAKQSFIVRF